MDIATALPGESTNEVEARILGLVIRHAAVPGSRRRCLRGLRPQPGPEENPQPLIRAYMASDQEKGHLLQVEVKL